MNRTPRRGANQLKHPSKSASFRNTSARHWLRGDLKAYVDGELPMWRQRLTAWHLQRCAPCREEASWLEQINGQFANWEQGETYAPRPELRARILACLPAESPLQLAQATPRVSQVPVSFRTRSRFALRPTLAMGSLAAMLLMVGAYALNLRHHTNLPTSPVSSDVALAAPPQHKVLMVFTAPKDSFDKVETPDNDTPSQPQSLNTVGTSVQMVTTSTSATPGKASGSGTAPASHSVAPSSAGYSDPTSREAERLASIAIGKMLNARRLQSLAAARREAHHPTTHTASANGTKMPELPPIALAVADVAETRRQIQQWAELSGAKLRVMAVQSGAATVGTADGAEIAGGTLLELRVPAPLAENFKIHLSQLGTPLVPSATNGEHRRHMPRLNPAETTAPDYEQPSTPATGFQNEHNPAVALVTLRVRLLASETLPRH